MFEANSWPTVASLNPRARASHCDTLCKDLPLGQLMGCVCHVQHLVSCDLSWGVMKKHDGPQKDKAMTNQRRDSVQVQLGE